MVFFSFVNIAPNVDGIIFRWRLIITKRYYVLHANVITKRHSNISAIRRRSEFFMLKCKRQAMSEFFFFGA